MDLSKPFKDLSVLEASIVRAVLGEDIRSAPLTRHSADSSNLSSSPVNGREMALAVQAVSSVLAESDVDDGAVACTVATPLTSSLLASPPTSTSTSTLALTYSSCLSLSIDPTIAPTNIASTHNTLPVRAVSHTHRSTSTSSLPPTERNSSNQKQREHDDMIEIEEKQYLKAKAIFDFITPSACLAFHGRGMKRKEYDYNNDYYDDNGSDNNDSDSCLALDGMTGTRTIGRDGNSAGNSESVEDTVTSSKSSSSHTTSLSSNFKSDVMSNDCNKYNRKDSKNNNDYNNDNDNNISSCNIKKRKKKKKKKNNNICTIPSIDNTSEVGIGVGLEMGAGEGAVVGVGMRRGEGGVGVGVGIGAESLESESLWSMLGFSSFKSTYKNI